MKDTRPHLMTLPVRLDERLYWMKILAVLLLVALLGILA